MPLAITIYKIHYYYACTCKREQRYASTHVELPLLLAHPRCAELTARDKEAGSLPLLLVHLVYAKLLAKDKKGRSLPLYYLFKQALLQVKFKTKPNFQSS